MNAGGPGQLGKAAEEFLDLERCCHHQVGKFIDDDDPVGELLDDASVAIVSLEIAHADFGELLVARLHFADDCLQGADHLIHVDDHFTEGHVRDPGERRELDTLRIDHDEANFVRGRIHHDSADDRVHADALARSRRPCDQQVRHLRQVCHRGYARDALAESQREL